MALPSKRKKPSTSKDVVASSPSKPALAQQALNQIDEMIGGLGLSKVTITIEDGKRSLKGRTNNGQAVNVVVRDSGSGFKERTVSMCDVLTIDDRQAEAKRLKQEGFTQAVIADKLGVSQKTISNDLNS